MPEVLALARRVERRIARNSRSSARTVTSRASPSLDAEDRELLAPGEPEALAALAGQELEWQDAHHQQVRAVDPLVALGDHGANAEEARPFRGPVPGRARAVLLARDHDERRPFGEVALRGVEDRHLLARGEMSRPCPLRAGHEQVAQAHVREGAADHHLVVAAARAVRVEVRPRDAMALEVVPGRRPGADRARRRDVVGGHRVAEDDEAARAVDVGDGAVLARHPVEVGRPPHVGRALLPGVELAFGHRQVAPGLVSGEDVARTFA